MVQVISNTATYFFFPKCSISRTDSLRIASLATATAMCGNETNARHRQSQNEGGSWASRNTFILHSVKKTEHYDYEIETN